MFAPYAFISSIDVDHLGLCRTLEIPFGQKLNYRDTNITETITAVVPEAYKITMTIEALNTNVRNFTLESLNKNNITTRIK